MRLNAAVLICIALVVAIPALAAPQCAPHDVVAAALKDRFGEAVQVQGLSADGRLVEVWANPVTGTWTATMTSPDGTTCMSVAGDRFQSTKPGEPA